QPGVVHQQVDRAEGELGLSGGGIDRDPVGDVGGEHHGAAPERLDLFGDGGQLLPVAGEQGDVQTGSGQGGGQCGSDTSGGAGDQGGTGSGNCRGRHPPSLPRRPRMSRGCPGGGTRVPWWLRSGRITTTRAPSRPSSGQRWASTFCSAGWLSPSSITTEEARHLEAMIAATAISPATTAITIRSAWLASAGTLITTTAGAISRETRFITLISGLIAGPAVSLNGSPMVSPMTVAECASEFLPP